MENLRIIRDNEGVRNLLKYLESADIVVLDTETTGVDTDAEIIGYGICTESGVAHYVVTAEWDVVTSSLRYLETKDAAPDVMRFLGTKRLVGHNFIFDAAQIERNYGVSLIDACFCDTMVLAHLTDENRRIGLKDLGAHYFGAAAKKEQEEMHASVSKNGGQLTKAHYELYKADSDLIAKYGCRDVILTYNLFYELLPQLYEDGMDKFFFEEESMPQLRGPTYDLNTAGLKVDLVKLADLKRELEVEIAQLKTFIYNEVTPLVHEKYPGTSAKTTFNIGSGEQLAWLLFERLENTFLKLSDAGQDLSKALQVRIPYRAHEKRAWIDSVSALKARVWKGKTKVKDPWCYCSTDKTVLKSFSNKYTWVEKLLDYKRLTKMLSTYVDGIMERTKYGIIRPSFLQTVVPSGRYSSRGPNFQNLQRDDTRVKACIVSRPGKSFVGADQSQIEARAFASLSGDKRLLDSFEKGEDFYSVIGMEVFKKKDCLPLKEGSPQAFGVKYKRLRQIAKGVALAATYGTTASKLCAVLEVSREEAQSIIDTYFATFPQVKSFQLACHEEVKRTGVVKSIYGRIRRLPEAMKIEEQHGNCDHDQLPYSARTLLNLAVNFKNQAIASSVINRAAIAIKARCRALAAFNPLWNDVKLVLNVHDEMVLEAPDAIKEDVAKELKAAMENTCTLPGVSLVAEPKIAKNLADLK